MIHALGALAGGSFATLIAKVDTATIAWQIIIFAVGILVGIACVLIADWHLRRQTERRAQSGRSADA